MSNQTASIIGKSVCKKKAYNILTFDTHERYQIQLAKTGHNFYSFRYDGCKEWDTQFGDKPKNYYTLPKNSIYHGIDFDFILSQSKFGQIQASHQINQMLRLPIVSLEHTLPIPSWPEGQALHLSQMTGDINVFISKYSVDQWMFTREPHEVVHHSVDTELFKPGDVERQKTVISVVNRFKERDYCCNYEGWCRITEPLKDKVKLVGENPGMSQSMGPKDLAKEYQRSLIFLNTSTISPVPTSLLEAMACGCAIVTTATCMIPEIIKDGVNGYISNDENQLQSSIQNLLHNPGLAKELGENARQTILEKFNEDSFVGNWNNIFNKAYGLKK